MTVEPINIAPIDRWIAQAVAVGATDLMLTPYSQPRMRVDGRLRAIPDEPVLDPGSCTNTILAMLPTELRNMLHDHKEIDFSFTYETTHRFRGNCFMAQNGLALALRAIPLDIPTPDELRLPKALADICQLPQGFVLVTGPTGSGKSTTLASLIDHINASRELHILTVEDPVEYVHQHKMSAVNQREVGVDTHTFDHALRSALREDPDVILVGEMRDPETIQFALTLAETGHLVFATLHTNDAAQALDRISDIFPPERQTQIRVQLAGSLAAVVSQRLVPKVGGGLVAAFELLLASNAVRNVVREGHTHQLRNIMHGSRAQGMLTLEASLNELVAANLITYDEAVARSMHPKEIKRSVVVPTVNGRLSSVGN
jgi:twitching motility protein PilT